MLVKWRSCRVWRRVRGRRVGAEKQFRDQAETEWGNCAREVAAADIEATPGNLKRVTGDVPVAAEKATGTLPEIGNDHNVRLIIARARFNPCLPLAHLIGGSQVCIPVTASDLQPTEFVD